MGNLAMGSTEGFRRLVAFSDAVVAIAITLLILPLVDAAGTIGSTSVHTFLDDNRSRMLGFLLSFAVIGRYWWAQHQTLERVEHYSSPLVAAMFLWLLSIVVLPFPTELISTATNGAGPASHAVYIGTLWVASVAVLLQQFAIVHRPAIQREEGHGEMGMTSAWVLVALMTAAFVVALAFPGVGLWSLLALLLTAPVEHSVAWFRRSHGPQAESGS